MIKLVDVTDETARLLELARAWNDHDPIPDGHKAEVKAIGEQLHGKGGWPLMSKVYENVRKRSTVDSCLIEAWWDGVGDWRW